MEHLGTSLLYLDGEPSNYTNEELQQAFSKDSDSFFEREDYLGFSALDAGMTYPHFHQWFVDNVQNGNDNHLPYMISRDDLNVVVGKFVKLIKAIKLDYNDLETNSLSLTEEQKKLSLETFPLPENITPPVTDEDWATFYHDLNIVGIPLLKVFGECPFHELTVLYSSELFEVN